MADPIKPAEPIAPAPVAAEPIVAAPVAPAVVETAPVVEVVQPVEAPKLATDEPTLLETIKAPGADDPKPEVAETDPKAEPEVKTEGKPEDGDSKVEPKPGDVKPEEKPVEAAKPEPVAYEYKLPETLKMDDALKGEFHGALDDFRADPAKGAQKLVDLHNKTMGDYSDFMAREQHRVFGETRKGWQREIMADPEIGGAGHKTAAQAIARARDMFVSRHPAGSKEYNSDFQAFDGMLRVTGVGDHPVFWRFLHNIAQFADEPQANDLPSEIKPAPVPNGKKGASVLYDNARSGKRQ